MAILIVDSSDSGFLNIILNLVNRFKGAKAELIDTNKSIEIVDDAEFLKEMIEASKDGVVSEDEKQAFLKELTR